MAAQLWQRVRWLQFIAVIVASLRCAIGFSHSATGTERNNWAVLVESSRYFYNYRHASNVLSFYHTVKRLGIPDSQILLMMAEDMPCNSRNARPGTVFNDRNHGLNLYGDEVEVDYRGDEVSVESFLRLFTGRHHPSTPRNKRLLTDSSSNIFIFITGHSGDEFVKFQDWEELTSTDIGDAFQQMHQQRRYNQIFWISDTCQAATLQNQFRSPGIIAMGSSGKKENSYSHHVDSEIGAAVVCRFTYHALHGLNRLTSTSTETLQSFTGWFNPNLLKANPEMRTDLFGRDPGRTLLTEFLAATGRPRFQEQILQLSSDPSLTPTLVGSASPLEPLLGGSGRKKTLDNSTVFTRPTSGAHILELEHLHELVASSVQMLRQMTPGKGLLSVDMAFTSTPEEALGAFRAVLWLVAFVTAACLSSAVL
eukprot:TRINITY_DN35121_c0_g1_i1.p1 TRINITY_DN35121_c0_g1~~TRINITY_DN35121_c0_g1_i1.p1  ORF type:complete len:432 (+),score=73.06 TRINITY_DN35121_c0_g1_i1:28-1296(+)